MRAVHCTCTCTCIWVLAYIHPLDNYSPSFYYHIRKYMYWPALSALLFIMSGRG